MGYLGPLSAPPTHHLRHPLFTARPRPRPRPRPTPPTFPSPHDARYTDDVSAQRRPTRVRLRQADAGPIPPQHVIRFLCVFCPPPSRRVFTLTSTNGKGAMQGKATSVVSEICQIGPECVGVHQEYALGAVFSVSATAREVRVVDGPRVRVALLRFVQQHFREAVFFFCSLFCWRRAGLCLCITYWHFSLLLRPERSFSLSPGSYRTFQRCAFGRG